MVLDPAVAAVARIFRSMVPGAFDEKTEGDAEEQNTATSSPP